MSDFDPHLPKHLRVPPKCDVEYLGVVSIKEYERLQAEATDGIFYVWTEVGYSQMYSGKNRRPTKAYLRKYTPADPTREE